MKNLIPRFIQQNHKLGNIEGEFPAITMNVGISGLTDMIEMLKDEKVAGEKLLAGILDDIFGKMVKAIYKRAGVVSGFTSDGLIAIFPFRDELFSKETLAINVFDCGERIQRILKKYGIQKTEFGIFLLKSKIGISAGTVRWGIVGKNQNAYFFRGEGIDGCLASECLARERDIIFDESVKKMVSIKAELIEDGYYKLHKFSKSLLNVHKLPKLPRRSRLDRKVIRQFIPKTLQNAFHISEFRNIVSVFISVQDAPDPKQDHWQEIVLKNVTKFSGYFNKFVPGEDGRGMLCVFGAPISTDDNLTSALKFILSLREELSPSDHPTFKAGIVCGVAFAGIIGGKKRAEYTVLGELVNRSAQLMTAANWGDVWVSEDVYQRAKEAYEFEALEDVELDFPRYVLK